MRQIGEQLTDRAREAGALRPDVTGADIVALTSAAAWLSDQVSADQADRLLTFTLAGLRPG
jgi:hypothetical protein